MAARAASRSWRDPSASRARRCQTAPVLPAATRALDGQRLVGIITERDLTAALAEDADPATTPVSDYMTPAPEVLRPDSELADAAHVMLELGIRHLPVVCSGQLVGVLSMRDVLDADVHDAEATR